MKKNNFIRFFFTPVLFFVLLILVLQIFHYLNIEINLTRENPFALTKRTVDFLKNNKSLIYITYYVSDSAKLPIQQIYLEKNVKDLLSEMKRKSNSHFEYRIVNITKNPSYLTILGREKISSFTIENVEQDKYVARSILSAMTINYMGVEKIIPYILNEHIPYLQERIITLMAHIEQPSRPIIGFLGTELNKYQLITSLITNFGELKIVDYNSATDFPDDADLLFVVAPKNITKKGVEFIDNFIKSGKNVFIFFDAFKITVNNKTNKADFSALIKPVSIELIKYFNEIGIYPRYQVIMDKDYNEKTYKFKTQLPDEQVQANINKMLKNNELKKEDTDYILEKMSGMLSESKDSGVYKTELFGLNVNPNRIYLNQFDGKRAGRVFFKNAFPLDVDEKRLFQSGYNYEAVITTPDTSMLIDFDNKESSHFLDNKNFVKIIGMMVENRKSWLGKLFLFSGSSFVSDNNMVVGGNKNFLKNILQTYTKPDRLLSIESSGERKSTIPDLNKFFKFIFRIIIIFLLPFLILIMALRRNVIVLNVAFLIKKLFSRSYIGLLFGMLIVILFINLSKNLFTFNVDLTSQKYNSLSPETKEIIRNLNDKLDILYITSSEKDLPFAGNQLLNHIISSLSLFKSTSKNINFEIKKINGIKDLNSETLQLLDQYNVHTFQVKTITEDRYQEQSIYSSLVFRYHGQVEVVKNILLIR